MTDKPISAGDGFALPDIAPVALTGADAARFAQAQFMNDVTALPAGHWQWNGWLTPKGRVIALFALLKHTDDDVLLLLLDANPADFCAALGRFVFRSKVTLNPAPDIQVAGRFIAPEKAQGRQIAELGEGRLELDFSAEGGPRRVWLTSTHHDAAAKADGLSGRGEQQEHVRLNRITTPSNDAAALERWRGFDLAHGLPRLLPGRAEHWTPQQLSLDRLKAYSVKKGCYPGQEIVARTHFLGQAKRGLVRLVCDQPVSPETGVKMDDAAPVPLVACAGQEALAVLALEAADTACSIAGRPVERAPLLDGFTR